MLRNTKDEENKSEFNEAKGKMMCKFLSYLMQDESCATAD